MNIKLKINKGKNRKTDKIISVNRLTRNHNSNRFLDSFSKIKK